MDLLNEVIGRVAAFGKMSGDGRIVVNWSHGVPSLALRDDDPPGILFYNDQIEDIPAYAYMPVTGYDSTNKILKVGKPSTTFCQWYLINGARVVPYQKTGRAQDSLEQRLLYNSGTPAVGEAGGPTPGQWYWSKGYPCASIVQGVHDSSAKIMLATLGPIDTLIGKLAGSLSQGSNATMNVWAGAPGSEAVVTSMTLTVYDWLMKSGATSIASGKKVIAKNINGNWYVQEAECA